MSDEEILRRLAEIEGVKSLPIGPDGMVCDLGNPTAKFLYEDGAGGYDWNPLTNDAQALGLVKKHEVLIEECSGDGWHTMCDGEQRCDPDLNRAICLAVIAAREGKP
jgi:hypothetical protein